MVEQEHSGGRVELKFEAHPPFWPPPMIMESISWCYFSHFQAAYMKRRYPFSPFIKLFATGVSLLSYLFLSALLASLQHRSDSRNIVSAFAAHLEELVSLKGRASIYIAVWPKKCQNTPQKPVYSQNKTHDLAENRSASIASAHKEVSSALLLR